MRRIISITAMISLVFSLSSCDTIVSKIAKKSTSKLSSEVFEEGAEKASSKAIGRSVAKIVGEDAIDVGSSGFTKTVVSKTLRQLAETDQSISYLYKRFSSKISKEFADGITAETTEKGIVLASKDFPNSAVRINKNMVVGKAGSLRNSGPVNEFLNHLLPNKTYIVDDAFIYKTDDLGRVISASADRNKVFGVIERNGQRNTDVQKLIVDDLGGRPGFDDGGHLFANTTGGPNELINQVPMSKSLNRNGQWRNLEVIEEKALKAGKIVTSQRNLLYHGAEKRPYAIEFITRIDGVETKTIVQNID